MALPAEKPHAEDAPIVQTTTDVADWYEVYYHPEPANTPTAPQLNALDQMFAYYDA